MSKQKLQKNLGKLLTYLQPFLKDKAIEVQELIDAGNPDSLDKAFNLLCYNFNYNEDYNEAHSNLSIMKYDFGKLYRQLLTYLYEEYEKTKKLDFEQIFPECSQLFKSYNATMLLPTNIIVAKPPNNATIVKFSAKNCKNIIFNIEPLVNKQYIEKHYAGITDKTGLNPTIIKRFQNANEYDECDDPDNYILDSIDGEIYQKINDKNYRKLINFKDYSRNVDHINYNVYISNWENKKILALKKPMREKTALNAHESILGIIKNNIYEKKMPVMSAVYSAVYNENMSDEDILRLVYHSHTFADKMPRGTIKAENMGKVFNLRFITDMALS